MISGLRAEAKLEQERVAEVEQRNAAERKRLILYLTGPICRFFQRVLSLPISVTFSKISSCFHPLSLLISFLLVLPPSFSTFRVHLSSTHINTYDVQSTKEVSCFARELDELIQVAGGDVDCCLDVLEGMDERYLPNPHLPSIQSM
jgi:hypothetical protein